ncbi:accessory Sec system translocase SecA2 [Paenibacillus sp. ACRRX]|uniref:accessory Sec system translocase SecA2 n=1 Tax=Paenibacillus sp. ACRRX TaxID=2918206 RepID=UPI001EF51C81|nr:accessory Sec system translocase SecA2 [Paenibacillus sp. ACRRX]MCG7409847.1 accessory Sec system translocase SecA2 [Paenibacillus sp. ACRRX]
MDKVNNSLYNRLNVTFNKIKLKSYEEKLLQVKSISLSDQTDAQILRVSQELKKNVQNGIFLENLLVEAAALVNEAAFRTIGYRLYDKQLVAGMSLYEGNMVEMQTGEGKTLSAVLPVYLNALAGKGAHVFTFNDYLARRDMEWMGLIYRYLGLTVSCIQERQTVLERKEAYAADVTYVTAKQACFDYLKDSLVYDSNNRVQRPLQFVLVDEADSILIDEARIPLVVAGDLGDSNRDFSHMLDIVKQLMLGRDYDTDDNKRNVYLSEEGAEKVEGLLGCGNLYEIENSDILTELNCMLHAETLLNKDIHYIVRDGKVQLIDEFTGRIADKRHWPDGLQAAVEVKEGLLVQSAGKILGSMTLQHFMSLYNNICGMTATAQSSTEEFKDTYNLDVVVIPPNKARQRIDYSPLIYTNQQSKWKAIVNEIMSIHHTGRPILVGTASVDESNQLAEELNGKGVTCHVLNAQHDQQEAEIIAKAGELSAVTVSTNMAGRGVDIILGGGEPEAYQKVAALGGLYVIGTNLHESVRIDKQLRGRAGRQGDPGCSKFIISLEDDLLVKFGLQAVLPEEYRNWQKDIPLEGTKIQKIIQHIQYVIEGQNYEIKKMLNKYSDIIEQQRKILFNTRNEVLLNQIQPNILVEREFEFYQNLCNEFGQDKIQETEKYVFLVQLDHNWADYLDYVSYIKESIHLESIGNENPLDVYNRQIIQAFERIDEKIQSDVVNVFLNMDLSEGAIDLDMEEMRIPSATWTYIINDNFFQNRVSLI